MTIQCGTVGIIPFEVSPDDEFHCSFDISTWLESGGIADTISSVAFTAVDEEGSDASADVLDAAENTNTNTVIQPYIMGGGTDNKQYIVKMEVTTATGYIKSFYIKFIANETAE